MSAILLPFTEQDAIDWQAFAAHVARTADCGLIPAVNMDTGYANLLDEATRQRVLTVTSEVCDQRPFVAGVSVADHPGSAFDLPAYARQIDSVQRAGGTPVVIQSYGLAHAGDEEILGAYQAIAAHCDRFIAFELGTMFAPFGRIYSLVLYRELLGISACIGAKHSSLRRDLEWERLILRNEVRPEFMVLTGNDLAIDMVMYGSDYLLGLSTMAPDLFALRDRYWLNGDAHFFSLNDVLQYLGNFAFRPPVPAYKHTAAMVLHLQDWIATNRTHPHSPRRPESDLEILSEIVSQLNSYRGRS